MYKVQIVMMLVTVSQRWKYFLQDMLIVIKRYTGMPFAWSYYMLDVISGN